ncbi:hypothetical protein FNO01nite_08080 [Flavobacterium noncentrifugens]|uniref:SnoaL-like domain-containing protein n=1 Tax=Flavobacterium noncentrifugens TaxID=1128970 RepID=A0A1G8T973_9FLAO|nr:nuclear transport factor 2 family protein [Flavobacterium noncentrifugens]GEP50136.1 hypothetical protein FNO01nite_08080 [Flavobacterium noncentrifugens]SDJ38112.1 SnoaL-like domain-containing protein [Flavobacterium noncentrifugens]
MKHFLFILAFVAVSNMGFAQNSKNTASINTLLNNWHKAAADAKFDSYFSFMSFDAVYIGTDASENWNMDQFKAFAKPYFDKGKAWNFTALQRHIYFSTDGNLAWFDELLDTQMKICRGSGILKKENGQWKIAHYVLSMTVPNADADKVTAIKATAEDKLIKELQRQE